jgi:hypothetical protein
MIQKSNARHKKSQYEKYVVMAHSQTNKLKLSYDGYLRLPNLKHLKYLIIFIMGSGMRLLKNVY